MRHFSTLVLLCLAVVGCDGGSITPPPTGGPTPASVVTIAGNGQSAIVGSQLQVGIQVLDANQHPIVGAQVSWQVSAGGGSVTPLSPETHEQGQAQATWTLGTAPGTQTLTATSGNAVATFTATAAVGPLARVTVTPETQTLIVGDTTRFTATAQDAFGNAIPVTSAQWTWSPATLLLNAGTDGARVAVIGNAAGQATVTATVQGVQGSAPLSVQAAAPRVVTLPPDAHNTVDSVSTRQFGVVYPRGADTEAWLEYGTDPALAAASSTLHSTFAASQATWSISRTLSPLTPGTVYYYRVVASNAQGATRGSIYSFRAGPPPPATGLQASYVSDSLLVRLTWNYDPTTAFTFEVRRENLTNGTYEVFNPDGDSDRRHDVVRGPAGTATFTDAYPLMGGDYLFAYSVHTCNFAGCTSGSPRVQVQTAGLQQPTNLTANPLRATEAQITWTDTNTNEDGYELRRIDPNRNYIVVQLPANTTSYLDTGLTTHTTYTFMVIATKGEDFPGKRRISNVAELTVTTP